MAAIPAPRVEFASPPTIRASLPLDRLELAFLLLFGAFIGASWLSFSLAELGVDRPLVALGLGGIALIGATLATWRRPAPGVDGITLAGLALVLGLGVALFFPPDEWILGALDPGSYVNAGAAIAKTSRVLLPSPEVAALPPNVRAGLFPFPASRLPGFYLTAARFQGLLPAGWTVASEQVVPHGFHLYPVILAFGYALGGVWPELAVVPLLALGGLAGFFLLVRRLFGSSVATLAAGLLAVSPAEVWFARYPAAEMLSQLLLFGGLLAFVAVVDDRSRWLALLAGGALGAVHLAKIEALPLPFLLAAYLGSLVLLGRFHRGWLWFLVPYLLLLGQSVAHATFVSTWYAATSVEKTLSLRTALAAVALLALWLGGVALVALDRRLRAPIQRLLQQPLWDRLIGVGAPVLVGGLALDAYLLRPLAAPSGPAAELDGSQLQVVNDLTSFLRLGWYVGPLGLLLGTLGWILLVHRERNQRTLLLLLLLAADTLLYLDHLHITPIHYWAARRWISLVIPGFCLAAAYLLVALWPRRREHWIEAAVPLGLGVALSAGLLDATRPLLGYVEYEGAVSQLAVLAATIPADGVALFPDGDAGERFSVPLKYLFDRESFVVFANPEAQAAAATAARSWLAAGTPVYWITTSDLPDPPQVGLRGRVVARQRISLPEKLATRDTPPGADGVFQQDLTIWQIER